MLSAYPACFIKEENGYSVIFPDLNHLSTCGNTLDEALTMAVDCLAGYLYWLERDGDPVPAPSPLDKINITDIVILSGISKFLIKELTILFIKVPNCCVS